MVLRVGEKKNDNQGKLNRNSQNGKRSKRKTTPVNNKSRAQSKVSTRGQKVDKKHTGLIVGRGANRERILDLYLQFDFHCYFQL